MPYEHRFGCTNKRNDCRHDPATFGIFIHGGSSMFPFFKPTDCIPWETKQSQRYSANRFSLTIPTRTRKGKEIVEFGNSSRPDPAPTFFKAVEVAKAYRIANPAWADCPIYACTDMLMKTRSSGEIGLQLICR
jgi:hypothetical protein